MKDFPLGSSGRFGFMQLEDGNGRSKFRYLTRSKILLTLLDAEGSSKEQAFETIDSIEFEISQSNTRIFLMVSEPPRSLRQFLNDLEELIGFGFSADAIIFNTKKQNEILRYSESFRMTGFKGIGSDSASKLVARVEVASKEGLELDRIPFLKALEYKIDHATFDVAHRMLRGQITFTASGIIRINGALEPFLLNCIERSLDSLTP